MHADKLVHRDLRLPNVVQLAPHQFMVIDLESVAAVTEPGLPKDFHHVLKTCTTEALDAARRFTAMSDMYLIGVLLEEAHQGFPAAAAENFIQKLMTKQLTAEEALAHLQHAWTV